MLEKNYYTDIDEISIRNWRRCQDKGLKYVRRDISIGDEKTDAIAWEVCYDSYLSRFGLGDEYSYYITVKRELAKIHLDFAISGDRFLLNRARELQNEIKKIDSKKSDFDIDKMINTISKWQGYRIDQNVVTWLEFQSLLRDFKEEVNNNNNGKR